ncbi:hypothetical protein [Actinomadura sp. NAK00032]|uniref:hypothetical protein n=1 Tax=Actinomadura sp. NAK00032 TaxID=2742128 RepID=UPI001C37D3B6|nr:hypothetical protein [Actinomadura sp. NAK00032]
MDGDAVLSLLDKDLARLHGEGIEAVSALVKINEPPEASVVAPLSQREWDVVVIGGGIRKPEPLLPLFEQIVNLVRRHAPGAAIAFNASVDDTYEAARRHL